MSKPLCKDCQGTGKVFSADSSGASMDICGCRVTPPRPPEGKPYAIYHEEQRRINLFPKLVAALEDALATFEGIGRRSDEQRNRYRALLAEAQEKSK